MISELASGECRAIGRPDLHVYCHHPMVETMMPWGRTGWQRRPGEARYRVICPAEGLEDYESWMPLDDAERIVSRILYADPRPKKRGAQC